MEPTVYEVLKAERDALLAVLRAAKDGLDLFLYRAEDSAPPEVEAVRDEIARALALVRDA